MISFIAGASSAACYYKNNSTGNLAITTYSLSNPTRKMIEPKIIEHLQQYEDTKQTPGNDLYGFTCGATMNSCWMTWRGHMTPCAMLEGPYTEPFEIGFLPAWEELKQLCDQILMSAKCSHCDKRAVCNTCPAANYAETGRFDCSAPFHCEMTQYNLEQMNDFVKEWGMEDRIVRRGENEP